MDTASVTPEQNAAQMARECGRTVLWVGVEAKEWGDVDYLAAARFAHAHGIDCICPKVADGSIKWYGTPARLAAIRDEVLREGVGFLPFLYSYGPKISGHQAEDEAHVVAEMLSVCPVVQIDMEAEWNSQTTDAEAFAALLRPVPGLVSISTWADPTQQDWQGVARALAPAVNAWTPQTYTNWLAGAAEAEYDPRIFTCIQPGIDLTQEFGANSQANIVHAAIGHGAKTFYFWEYKVAQNNPALLDELVSIIRAGVPDPHADTHAGQPAPAPAPAPAPEPTPTPAPRTYRVVSGDNLSELAARFYGHGDEWPRIYDANRAVIGADPNMLHIGVVLTIP